MDENKHDYTTPSLLNEFVQICEIRVFSHLRLSASICG